MDYNQDKVDEVVLALMNLTLHDERYSIGSAWKGYDWGVLDRLHEKGWIADPKTKAKSLVLTEEGLARSTELFERHFVTPYASQAKEHTPNVERGRFEAVLARVPDVEPEDDDRL